MSRYLKRASKVYVGRFLFKVYGQISLVKKFLRVKVVSKFELLRSVRGGEEDEGAFREEKALC
jgi:hypothetical protein